METRVTEKFPSSLADDQGWTLIEVLAALAILTIVLVPMTELVGYMFTNTYTVDRLNATQLAERELELGALLDESESKEYTRQIGRREYRVVRLSSEADGMIKTKVQVFLVDKSEPLIEFERYSNE